MAGDARTYSISEVAEAFGVSVSALRYYEEAGLLESTGRRGRVRYYDGDALMHLAYMQLWREDGMMSIAQTRAVLEASTLDDRRAVIDSARAQIRQRIAGLRRAEAVLTHMLDCRTDAPLECPMTGDHVRRRVEAALTHGEVGDGFLPD